MQDFVVLNQEPNAKNAVLDMVCPPNWFWVDDGKNTIDYMLKSFERSIAIWDETGFVHVPETARFLPKNI